MRIINLANNAYTNYILLFENEAVLVDCGFSFKYEKFLKKLNKLNIDKSLIKTVVITHVHQDHLSYLQSLLDDVNPKVIIGKGGKDNLLLGHDKLLTYSSKFNKWLTEFTAKLRGGPASWKPIDLTKYNYVEVEEDNSEILSHLGLKITTLPGHTLDSIGIEGKDDYIIGDAMMPFMPAKHSIPLLIESENDFKLSYDKLIASSCNAFYSGHGGVITKDKLKKSKKFVEQLKIV